LQGFWGGIGAREFFYNRIADRRMWVHAAEVDEVILPIFRSLCCPSAMIAMVLWDIFSAYFSALVR
jgi:hypothetical protein